MSTMTDHLTDLERHHGAPIRDTTDGAAYRALGAASALAPDITDAELAQWALDATVATVADTATDEERARLAAWVREGARRA